MAPRVQCQLLMLIVMSAVQMERAIMRAISFVMGRMTAFICLPSSANWSQKDVP